MDSEKFLNKDHLSTYSKNSWANGNPSIEIEPYDYSVAGFKKIVEKLSSIMNVGISETIVGLDTLILELSFENEIVTLMMDNWSCSISCKTEKTRDLIFKFLSESE
jgi:hypothetical protein